MFRSIARHASKSRSFSSTSLNRSANIEEKGSVGIVGLPFNKGQVSSDDEV